MANRDKRVGKNRMPQTQYNISAVYTPLKSSGRPSCFDEPPQTMIEQTTPRRQVDNKKDNPITEKTVLLTNGHRNLLSSDESVENDESTIIKTHQEESSTNEAPPPWYHQYMRDIMLGVNDGLVSMFLLMLATVGSQASHRTAILTGIAGSLAGAISMGIGEAQATKTQAEVFRRRCTEVENQFRQHGSISSGPIIRQLKEIGIQHRTALSAAQDISSDIAHMVEFKKRFEWDMTNPDDRRPFIAMLSAAVSFMIGSLPAVLPFILPYDIQICLYVTCALCSVALFAVGSAKTITTNENAVRSGLENLIYGALAAVVSWIFGYLFYSYVL